MLVPFQEGEKFYYVTAAQKSGKLVSYTEDKNRAVHFSLTEYEAMVEYSKKHTPEKKRVFL